MHLHEVLAAEFAALHGQTPPAGSAAAVPLREDLEAEESRKIQEQEQQRHLKNIWAAVHQLGEKRTALCISGGGIRSATFALGVLQGLARCRLLGKFHYLSTVSGGGYIGGWLTAWIQRAEGGLTEVSTLLGQPTDDAQPKAEGSIKPAPPRDLPRPNPEPIQIQNLRSYSNYLSPSVGLLSADTWVLVATYLRNLILTWQVFIPLVAAALTIPWLYASVLLIQPTPYTDTPLIFGVGFALITILYMGFCLPARANKRLGQVWFLVFCLAPLVLSALCMTTYWAWFTRYGRPLPEMIFLGVTNPALPFVCLGVVLKLVAWLMLSVLRVGRTPKKLKVDNWKRFYAFLFRQVVTVVLSGAIGGWLLWFSAQKLFPQPVARGELYCCFGVPIYLILFYLAVTVYTGLASHDTNDDDREWWARASGWILIAAAVWTAISVLVVFGPLALDWTYSTITAGGLAGLITMLAGLSKGAPANDEEKKKGGFIALILSKGATIAALVFASVVMILLVKGMTSLMNYIGNIREFPWDLDTVSGVVGRKVVYLNVLLYTPICALIWLPLGLVGVAVAIAYLTNLNKFSLHAMYRDRLIRAYLGASNKDREENRFTGFDEDDNVRMHGLWTERNSKRLLHVVNVALNLVHGKKLAWQDRKATSFTFSPLHCGSFENGIGYRRTKTDNGGYGHRDGISLGTSITISGAAASPNMGYHSSPVVTFILTLLNVRLGAWLGNPGRKGDNTFYLGYPRLSIRPILSEAFGLTDDTSPYVYLSDGGHFENLGLYEMVLRRCHYIVVSDAGQDPKCAFTDLGEAVRKIRIDLGISIDFSESMSIYPRRDEPNEAGRYAAIGRIRYSMVDGEGVEDGVLIYIKPACYGDEPRDIYEYFKRNPAFPHESTGDQFFSESQFESYRMLGVHTVGQLCQGPVADFPTFIRGFFGDKRHLGPEMPEWLKKHLLSSSKPGDPNPNPTQRA